MGLSELSGDEGRADVIASHDLAAYQCSPNAADAERFALQAVTSLRSAIERAWLLGAFGQVAALASDAVALTSSEADRAVLHERRAEAAIEVGDYADALVGLEDALDFHHRSGDSDAAARVATTVDETEQQPVQMQYQPDTEWARIVMLEVVLRSGVPGELGFGPGRGCRVVRHTNRAA